LILRRLCLKAAPVSLELVRLVNQTADLHPLMTILLRILFL
jgi:hypothetical protein